MAMEIGSGRGRIRWGPGRRHTHSGEPSAQSSDVLRCRCGQAGRLVRVSLSGTTHTFIPPSRKPHPLRAGYPHRPTPAMRPSRPHTCTYLLLQPPHPPQQLPQRHLASPHCPHPGLSQWPPDPPTPHYTHTHTRTPAPRQHTPLQALPQALRVPGRVRTTASSGSRQPQQQQAGAAAKGRPPTRTACRRATAGATCT